MMVSIYILDKWHSFGHTCTEESDAQDPYASRNDPLRKTVNSEMREQLNSQMRRRGPRWSFWPSILFRSLAYVQMRHYN